MPAALAFDQQLRTIHRIPATIAAIAPVRTEIADTLAACAWDAAEAMSVVLAASEGMVNAVEHGSRDGAHVTVSFAIDADRAEMTIADDGRPGDPPRDRPEDDTRGRGMLLINGFATELRYEWSPAGTVLFMAFARGATAA